MANNTRSRQQSPTQLRKRTHKMPVFRKVWDSVARKGGTVQDVAYRLGWHVDEVVYCARQSVAMLALIGETMPMVKGW
jgi:hypothetical protein